MLDKEIQFLKSPINEQQAIGIVKKFAPNVDTLTASQLVATDASKNLQSLSVATYPSLTEIANVKNVNAPIQTQIDQCLSFLPSLPRFKAALTATKAGTRNTKIVFIGDSTTAGVGTPTIVPESYPIQMAQQMTTVKGYYGGKLGIYGGNTNQDPRWVMGTGWNPSIGSIGGNVAFCATSGVVASFTPVEAFNTIDVYYIQVSSYGNLLVNVDGGATLATIVQGANPTCIKKATITCPLGTHTINFTTTSTSQTNIIGCSTYNSAIKGIECLNAGIGGYRADQVAISTNIWDTFNTTATLSPLGAIAPDLLIVNLGINDALQNTATATTQTALQLIADNCRNFCDVIFITFNPWAYTYNAGVNSSYLQQRTYANLSRIVAANGGIPIVDLYANWGTQAFSSGYLSSDTLHPSVAGYAAEATLIRKYLGLT